MKKSLTILFTIAALLLQGCGSVANLVSEDPQNYGGVERDLRWLGSTSEKPVVSSPDPQSKHPAFPVFVLALIPTEVALSAMIDTLALPYTIHQNRKGHQDDDRPTPPRVLVETVVNPPSADGTRLSTGD